MGMLDDVVGNQRIDGCRCEWKVVNIGDETVSADGTKSFRLLEREVKTDISVATTANVASHNAIPDAQFYGRSEILRHPGDQSLGICGDVVAVVLQVAMHILLQLGEV